MEKGSPILLLEYNAVSKQRTNFAWYGTVVRWDVTEIELEVVIDQVPFSRSLVFQRLPNGTFTRPTAPDSYWVLDLSIHGQIPAKAFIDSAARDLLSLPRDLVNRELDELESMGQTERASLEDAFEIGDLELGYLLGLQTARVLVRTMPKAIQAGVEF